MMDQPVPEVVQPDQDLTLLIDADFLPYQAGFQITHKTRQQDTTRVETPKGDIVYVEDVEKGEALIWTAIFNLKQRFRTDKAKLFVTGTGNFRHEIAVTRPYKENRNEGKRPTHHAALEDYMIRELGAEVIDGHEADDEVCIQQYACMQEGKRSIICGPDKDLRNMFGHYYTADHREILLDSTPFESALHFYKQLVCGDSTDCIDGIKGQGPAAWKKVLEQYAALNDIEAKIRQMYHKKHGDNGDKVMLEMGRLLHMKRTPTDEWHFDYNWEEGYVKLPLLV